jgi:hypothetical protein
MANVYDKGDVVEFTATFTDSAGTAMDPSAVIFITEDPAGTQVGYHYGLSSQGNWDASTNIPALANGTGTAGHYYTVTVAGSVNFGNGSITFAVGDYVFYNGHEWQKLPSPSSTTPTKSGTGVYYVRVYKDTPGTWFCRAEGVGTGQSADESSVIVTKSEI